MTLTFLDPLCSQHSLPNCGRRIKRNDFPARRHPHAELMVITYQQADRRRLCVVIP